MAATLTLADVPESLRALLDASSMQPTIETLLRSSGLVPTGTHDVRVLRFKDDRHCLLQYTLTDNVTGAQRHLVAKWFTKDRRAKRLWTILKAGRDDQREHDLMPVALRYDKDGCVVYMSFLEGTLLKDLLERDPTAATLDVARACAETLARFHDLPVEDGKPGTLDDELVSLRKHVEEHGDPDSDAGRLIDMLEVAARRLGPSPAPTVVHTGYRVDSIMLDGDRARMLDLDGWAMGDPAMDAGCFIAEVWRLAGEPGMSEIAPLAEQFREHYIGLRPSEGLRERIDLYEAYTLIRLALRRMRNESRGKIRPKSLDKDDYLVRAEQRLGSI